MNKNFQFSRPTLITLTASTCAGKSVLLNNLVDEGFERIVSTTTRAQRSSEIKGIDYFYISEDESKQLEEDGKFAELVTFRGVRYGVTHEEMNKKMKGDLSPVVILEPGGLALYKKYCALKNWGIYKIFISAPEKLRIERLKLRTINELKNNKLSWNEVDEETCASNFTKIIEQHTSRTLSITNEERNWSSAYTWDMILSGESTKEETLNMLVRGVKRQNVKYSYLS